MPEAIALAIEAVAFGGEWVFTAGQIAAIGQAALVIGSAAIGQQQKLSAKRRAIRQYNSSLKDREITIRGGTNPRTRVFGRDRVGGQLVDVFNTGALGEYLHVVVALAEGECDAVEQVWFGDQLLPAPDGAGNITSGTFVETINDGGNTNFNVSGDTFTLPQAADAVVTLHNVTTDTAVTGYTHTPGSAVISGLAAYAGNLMQVSYKFTTVNPCVRIKHHMGGPGQVADADLVAESAGRWTSAHVGNGVCYSYIRLRYVPEVFAQVGLPELRFVLRGEKVLDVRTGLTQWTENQALIAAHWLRDQRDGLRATAQQMPATELGAEANICDEAVPTSASTSQPRYTFNGSFTTEQSPRDVLQDILQAGAASAIWAQGRWLLRVGAYRTPAAPITEAHLAGSAVQIAPCAPKGERFNAVRVTHRDPAQGWAEVQAPLVANPTYQAQDGGAQVVRKLELPFACDALRAQRLGKIELERHRQASTITVTTNARAYDLLPTDTVPITLARYGYAAKVHEVLSRTLARDMTLTYTARETAPEVWAWNYGEATTVDLAPNTNLPNPYARPAALAGLSAQSGTTHLLRQADGTVVTRAWLQWTPTAQAFVAQGGSVQVQWQPLGAADWQDCPSTPGDGANTYVYPVPDGQVCIFRIRPVNGVGRAGDWSAVAHRIIGKTALPADVAGLSAGGGAAMARILWARSTEADYAYTALRVGASWAAGTPLAEPSGSSYDWAVAAPGTYTVWARHVDTSGNQSATAVSASLTVTAPTSGGGGNVTYYQTTAPGSAPLNDTWVDIDNGNAHYRGDGTAWVLAPVGTSAIAAGAVSVSTIDDVALTSGTSSPPGASVVNGFFLGPQVPTAADDELDIAIRGKRRQTFYIGAASAEVECWLNWSATFGGAETEIPGTRRRFNAALADATGTTHFQIDCSERGFKPGAASLYYNMRYTITFRDSAGAALQCAKDHQAEAAVRITRRKR